MSFLLFISSLPTISLNSYTPFSLSTTAMTIDEEEEAAAPVTEAAPY
jgi:hypothetical protein